MKTVALLTAAIMTAFTAAHADPLAPAAKTSDVDSAASMRVGGYSPGTIGAMNAVVAGIATSPEDVVSQQVGRSTALDGHAPLLRHTATQAAGQSPGTVGAAPGF